MHLVDIPHLQADMGVTEVVLPDRYAAAVIGGQPLEELNVITAKLEHRPVTTGARHADNDIEAIAASVLLRFSISPTTLKPKISTKNIRAAA